MLPANTYTLRPSSPDDGPVLARLAELDGRRPLRGPTMLAEKDGVAVAALALDDGRAVADPFRPTALALILLRARADALAAEARTPSLRDRMRDAVRIAGRPVPDPT